MCTFEMKIKATYLLRVDTKLDKVFPSVGYQWIPEHTELFPKDSGFLLLFLLSCLVFHREVLIFLTHPPRPSEVQAKERLMV